MEFIQNRILAVLGTGGSSGGGTGGGYFIGKFNSLDELKKYAKRPVENKTYGFVDTHEYGHVAYMFFTAPGEDKPDWHEYSIMAQNGLKIIPSPPQLNVNIFKGNEYSQASTYRDDYFTANPDELAKYDADPLRVVVLEYGVSAPFKMAFEARIDGNWRNPLGQEIISLDLSTHSYTELKDGEILRNVVNTTYQAGRGIEFGSTEYVDPEGHHHRIYTVNKDVITTDELKTVLKGNDVVVFKEVSHGEGKPKTLDAEIDCDKLVSHFISSADSVGITPDDEGGVCKVNINSKDFIGYFDTDADLEKFSFAHGHLVSPERTFAFVYQQGEGGAHPKDMPIMMRYTTRGNAVGDTNPTWKSSVPYGYGAMAIEDDGTRMFKPIQAIKKTRGVEIDADGIVEFTGLESAGSFIGIFGRSTDLYSAAKLVKSTLVKGKSFGLIRVRSKIGAAGIKMTDWYTIFVWNSDKDPSEITDADVEWGNNWVQNEKLAQPEFAIRAVGLNTLYPEWYPHSTSTYSPNKYKGQIIFYNRNADSGWYASDGTKWHKIEHSDSEFTIDDLIGMLESSDHTITIGKNTEGTKVDFSAKVNVPNILEQFSDEGDLDYVIAKDIDEHGELTDDKLRLSFKSTNFRRRVQESITGNLPTPTGEESPIQLLQSSSTVTIGNKSASGSPSDTDRIFYPEINVDGLEGDGVEITEVTDATDPTKNKIKFKVTGGTSAGKIQFLGFFDSEASIFNKAIEVKSDLEQEVTFAYLRHAPHEVTTEEAGSYEIYRWKGVVSKALPTDEQIRDKNNWHTGTKFATGGYPVVLVGTGTPYSSWTPTATTSYQAAHYHGQMVFHTNDKSWYWSNGTEWSKLFPTGSGDSSLFLGFFGNDTDLPASPVEKSWAYVLNPTEAGVVQRANPTMFVYQGSRWGAEYPRGSIIVKNGSRQFEHVEKIQITGGVGNTITDGVLQLSLPSGDLDGKFLGFFNTKADLETAAETHGRDTNSYGYVLEAEGEGSHAHPHRLIPAMYQWGGVDQGWIAHHVKGAIVCKTDKSAGDDPDRPIEAIKFTGDGSKVVENPNRNLTIEIPFTMDSHFVGIFENMTAFTESAKTYKGKFIKYQITGIVKQVGEYKLVRWNQDTQRPVPADIDNDTHWDRIPLGSGGSGTNITFDGNKVASIKKNPHMFLSESGELDIGDQYYSFLGYYETTTALREACKPWKRFLDNNDGASFGLVRKQAYSTTSSTKTHYYRVHKWICPKSGDDVTDADVLADASWDQSETFLGKDLAITMVGDNSEHVAWRPEVVDSTLKASEHVGQIVYWNNTDPNKRGHYWSNGSVWDKVVTGGSTVVFEGQPVRSIRKTNTVHFTDGELVITGKYLGMFDSQDLLFARAKAFKQYLVKDETIGYIRKSTAGSGEASKGTHYIKVWLWKSTKDPKEVTDDDVENVNNWDNQLRLLNADYPITVVGSNSEYPDWTPTAVSSALPASKHIGQIVYWNTSSSSDKGHYYSNGDTWSKLSSGGSSSTGIDFVNSDGTTNPTKVTKIKSYAGISLDNDGTLKLGAQLYGFLGYYESTTALRDTIKEGNFMPFLGRNYSYGLVRKGAFGDPTDTAYYKVHQWILDKDPSTVTSADVDVDANWSTTDVFLNKDHALTVVGTGTEHPAWTPSSTTSTMPANKFAGQIVWCNTDSSKGHYYSDGTAWNRLSAGSSSGILARTENDAAGLYRTISKIDVIGDRDLANVDEDDSGNLELTLNLKNPVIRATDETDLKTNTPTSNKGHIGFTSDNGTLYIPSQNSETKVWSWTKFGYTGMDKEVASMSNRFSEKQFLEGSYSDDDAHKQTDIRGITELCAKDNLNIPIPQDGVLESLFSGKQSSGNVPELWIQRFTGFSTGQEWKRHRYLASVSGTMTQTWSSWKEVQAKLPLDDTNFTILTVKNGAKVKNIKGSPVPWRKLQDNTCNVKVNTTNNSLRVLRDGRYTVTVVMHFSGKEDWISHGATVTTELLFDGESTSTNKRTGNITAGASGNNPGEYPATKAVFTVDLHSNQLFDIRHIITKGDDETIDESDLDPFKNYVVIEPANSLTETGVQIAETYSESLGGLSFLPGQEVRMDASGSLDRVIGERYRTDTVELR